jgi:glycogen operon protein
MARTLPVERLDMTLNELLAQSRIEWHGVQLGAPDWGDTSHSLAATMHFNADALRLHLLVNAYWEPLTFALPGLEANHEPWRRCVDTSLPSPADICPWAEAQVVPGLTYIVRPRSLAVLAARTGAAPENKRKKP